MEQANDSPTQISGALRREQLRVAQEVDSICDKFEQACQQGPSPSVGEFLKSLEGAANTNPPSSTLLLELVKIDVEYRARRGETPDLESYAREFPSYRALLSDVVPADDLGATKIRPLQQVDTLERFVLQSRLGAGTFGVVWKAWDPRLERWVAIKQFRENLSAQSRRLFQREARAVARLSHPNVVQVLELSESIGQLDNEVQVAQPIDFIVFEFVDGQNLQVWQDQRVEGRQVPAEEVARIGLQLARGLQHVHDQGLIHRDFKPTNVLMGPEGAIKIVDFGLARHVDALTTISRDQSIMGTVPYMSPEQCRAEPVTAATDIYSLGVVIYELLTGQRPFSGSRNDMLQAIQFATPARPAALVDVPESLENICLRAMEKQPEDRYRTAGELAADLERFLAGSQVSAVPAERTATFRGSTAGQAGVGEAPPNRRRFLSWAAGSAMFAGLGSAALLMNREPNDGKRVAVVTTNPPGANIAIVPVDPVSGDVIPSELEHVRGVTPLRHRLLPGMYLVIAHFPEDPTRFHEVYRSIPETLGPGQGAFVHQISPISPSGEILWLNITIPEPTVNAGMAQVPGANSYLCGMPGSTLAPPVACSIPGFRIDPYEFTVAEYHRVLEGKGPYDARSKIRLGPQQAVNISWDEAISRAERAGKRLLHEFEYEYVATAPWDVSGTVLGSRKYPWGDDLPEGFFELDHLGDVGIPDFDQVRIGEVEVYGLFSGVMEWVQTRVPRSPEQELAFSRDAPGERGVRSYGGVLQLGDHVTPRVRGSFRRYYVDKSLGFRCGRSLAPRLKPKDYVSYRLPFQPSDVLPRMERP